MRLTSGNGVRLISISLVLLGTGCGGGNNGSSSVGNPTITSVSVSCSPPSIQVNQTSMCSATVTGTGAFDASVAWSVDTGSIDKSGNYTAPATPSTATVKATSNQDSTKSGTATIAVKAPPSTISSVSVSCLPSSIPVNQSSKCTSVVSGTGDFDPSVKWSADIGSIDQSGNYTATSEPTTATVKATSTEDSTKSGTAVVNVIAGVPLDLLTIKPNAPVSGNSSTGTVVSTVPAPAGGVTVLLSSSNGSAAILPPNVTIPAGTTTAKFTIKAGVVANPTSLTIAAVSATTKSAALIVNPAATVDWNGGPEPLGGNLLSCVKGDFDGDGKTDFACYSGVGGIWNVALSTGGGWQLSNWTNGPEPSSPAQCLGGDFNGDGKSDLFCETDTSGNWAVALSTGSGWQLILLSGIATTEPTNYCFTGDLNDDGFADLACLVGANGAWNVGLSTGTAWQVESWTGPTSLDNWPVSYWCNTGDFDGDGKTDVGCYAGGGSSLWNVGLSTGENWNTQQWNGGPIPAGFQEVTAFTNCFSGDFNHDGLTDVTCFDGNVTWYVGLSNGSSWQTSVWSGGPEVASPASNQCLTGDFNGDGKTDLACYSGGSGVWGVALSTGSSFGGGLWYGGPMPIGQQPSIYGCIIGDFNGDGITDVACYSGGDTWQVALSSGSGW